MRALEGLQAQKQYNGVGTIRWVVTAEEQFGIGRFIVKNELSGNERAFQSEAVALAWIAREEHNVRVNTWVNVPTGVSQSP